LFKISEVLVNKLACINNCAERGIALIQTFNQTIVKHKEQK